VLILTTFDLDEYVYAALRTGAQQSTAVLLDTFGVRTLLVPSIVVLLGRWNWWPSRNIGVQGAGRPHPQQLTVPSRPGGPTPPGGRR